MLNFKHLLNGDSGGNRTQRYYVESVMSYPLDYRAWWLEQESNLCCMELQSIALPTELSSHNHLYVLTNRTYKNIINFYIPQPCKNHQIIHTWQSFALLPITNACRCNPTGILDIFNGHSCIDSQLSNALSCRLHINTRH